MPIEIDLQRMRRLGVGELSYSSLASLAIPQVNGVRIAARRALLKESALADIATHEERVALMNTNLLEVTGLGNFHRTEIGEIFEEPNDNGQTINYVVPLVTPKGTVRVQVNGAWGVHWRLDESHEAYGNAALSAIQRQDDPTAMVDGNGLSVTAADLERFTRDVAKIDPQLMAEDIQRSFRFYQRSIEASNSYRNVHMNDVIESSGNMAVLKTKSSPNAPADFSAFFSLGSRYADKDVYLMQQSSYHMIDGHIKTIGPKLNYSYPSVLINTFLKTDNSYSLY